MPITFEEVTAEIEPEARPQAEPAPPQAPAPAEMAGQIESTLRLMAERRARLCAD